MSALIVFLPRDTVTASTEFDYVLTHDGSAVADHGSAQAPLLPALTRAGSELVAVVPVSMISWHKVTLPKGTSASSPRLRAVLEGLLEDQLLDDPEALHFAAQPNARGGDALWVATCDRAWLRAAVHALETAGRPAARIVPEFAPEGETALYATGDAQQPSIVAAGAEGITALPLSAQSLALLPTVTPDTPLLSEPAVAELAEQAFQRRPVLRHPADRWLRAAQSPWDFAQFEFSSSGRARAFKKLGTAWADVLSAPQWKPARWGAIALVAVNLVAINAWAWRERASQDTKREAIRKTLTDTFPQVKLVVDAPVQMQRELAALRQAAGATSGNDMEAMLAALASALPPARAMSGAEYNSGELRVKGLALGGEESGSVIAGLKSLGYNATLSGETLTMVSEGGR